MSVDSTIDAYEAQVRGVSNIDLTTEEVLPNITQGRKSYRQKGKHSIKINEEPVEED